MFKIIKISKKLEKRQKTPKSGKRSYRAKKAAKAQKSGVCRFLEVLWPPCDYATHMFIYIYLLNKLIFFKIKLQ